MVAATPVEPAPSLFGVTFHRSTVLGRFFLGYSLALSMILGVAFALTGGVTFTTSYPLILPIFGVVGSMGALQVFVSDRSKGTLEYFLAYGVSPRRLFANVLLTTVLLVAMIVGISISASVGVYVAKGHPLTGSLAMAIGLYAIPMSIATAAFATIVGMYWSALSSPRTGVNSPIGLAPLIGEFPPVLVLITITLVGVTLGINGTEAAYLAFVGMLVVAAVTLGLLAMSGRLLRPERFLSNT